MNTEQFPIDIISYCQDCDQWQNEAQQHAASNVRGFAIGEDGRADFNDVIPRTQVHYKVTDGTRKSVCLVRIQDQTELDIYNSFTNLKRLGIVSLDENGHQYYDFDTGLDQDLYESVWDTTPVQYGSYTHYPPYMFALFA